LAHSNIARKGGNWARSSTLSHLASPGTAPVTSRVPEYLVGELVAPAPGDLATELLREAADLTGGFLADLLADVAQKSLGIRTVRTVY